MRTRIARLPIALPLAVLLLASATPLIGQFTVGGQILQRSEFRNGYGKLIDTTQSPAVFIGHRARIHALYTHEKVRFHVSVQDVRTWGNTEQTKATDAFLSVHEAWAEILFNAHWNLKLGRQELTYDEARFLGNLDWALQARAHDFALLRYEKGATKVHVGGGYNAGAESLAQQPYTIANQYKDAQFLRAEQRWGGFTISAMLWNNGLEQQRLDSAGAVASYITRYSQTFGLPTLRYERGRFTVGGFFYAQAGKDRTNRDLEAYDAGASASYALPLDSARGSALRFTLGAELLSGTAQNATDNVNRSYNPFYGTNHAWNGYMDYFYVGGRWGSSVGLMDAHLRLRYDPGKRTFISLNVHDFQAAAEVLRNGEKMDRRLGTELDFTVGHLLNEVVSLQFGYSHMLPTETMERLQGVAAPASVQNWAYLAILYRPNMKNRFAGLKF